MSEIQWKTAGNGGTLTCGKFKAVFSLTGDEIAEMTMRGKGDPRSMIGLGIALRGIGSRWGSGSDFIDAAEDGTAFRGSPDGDKLLAKVAAVRSVVQITIIEAKSLGDEATEVTIRPALLDYAITAKATPVGPCELELLGAVLMEVGQSARHGGGFCTKGCALDACAAALRDFRVGDYAEAEREALAL